MNKKIETDELNEKIKAVEELDKKIQEELSISIPDYILSEIVDGGYKQNVVALVGLAKFNKRISEKDAEKFVKNIDKYILKK